MTTTVDLPESIEAAIRKKIDDGEYTSKSDFIKEAVRTHLDRILLAPEDVAERAREVQSGEAETVNWREAKKEF